MGNTAKISSSEFIEHKVIKSLPVGTWEGISSSLGEFKVLKITANNQHKLISYRIANGMQSYNSIVFSNEDIKCDEFNCQIYLQTALENLPLKVSLTDYVGTGYIVTEAVKLKSGNMNSSSYRLDKVASITTPSSFITKETKKLTTIASIHKNKRFGYWAGILKTSNDEQLKFATLDYQPDKVATFTVYTPGLPYEAKMNFNPDWLEQKNGELTTKVSGALFASQLTLRYPLRDVINGNFEQRFERYPERLINNGMFTLYRVKPISDYKQPKWLKAFLKKLE